MFKKLKDKLSNWSKKVSEETESEETSEKDNESQEKDSTEKKEESSKKTKTPESEKSETLASEDSQYQEKTKQIEIPKKFNIGTQKFEPDLEKIQETEKEISKKELKKQKPEKNKEKQKKGFFSKFSSTTKAKISEKDFEENAEELELILLENNVALETTEKIIQELKEKLLEKEIPKKQLESEIHEALKETIKSVLSDPYNIEEKIKEKSSKTEEPYTILFCGINGAGKTTTIAKIANRLKQKEIKPIIAAGDTFRAASIEQLEKHGQNLDIKVISNNYGSDPASVGFDAIKAAKKNKLDCVLIDTAGRMHTDKNLLKEIEKISRICKPDLKVFVGESITGNDSIEQIKAFNETIGIDAIILSKADIDDKGGTALSLGHLIKKPILYLGTGQNYEDLEIFDKEKFLEKLGL